MTKLRHFNELNIQSEPPPGIGAKDGLPAEALGADWLLLACLHSKISLLKYPNNIAYEFHEYDIIRLIKLLFNENLNNLNNFQGKHQIFLGLPCRRFPTEALQWRADLCNKILCLSERLSMFFSGIVDFYNLILRNVDGICDHQTTILYAKVHLSSNHQGCLFAWVFLLWNQGYTAPSELQEQ